MLLPERVLEPLDAVERVAEPAQVADAEAVVAVERAETGDRHALVRDHGRLLVDAGEEPGEVDLAIEPLVAERDDLVAGLVVALVADPALIVLSFHG